MTDALTTPFNIEAQRCVERRPAASCEQPRTASRTRFRDTCAARSVLRTALRDVVLQDWSRREIRTSVGDARDAGRAPKSSPVRTDNPDVRPSASPIDLEMHVLDRDAARNLMSGEELQGQPRDPSPAAPPRTGRVNDFECAP